MDRRPRSDGSGELADQELSAWLFLLWFQRYSFYEILAYRSLSISTVKRRNGECRWVPVVAIANDWRPKVMKCILREYRNLVKNLIKRYLPNCMNNFPRRNFQEPDYTAGLAIGLPKLLNADKRTTCCGLRFGGCFIHQKPYVTYKDSGKPVTRELGDLLVLCRERHGKEERFNAALLQLKMANDGCNRVESGQLKIYTEWPKFYFGRKCVSGDSKEQYDVYPKTVTQGALYSFVHMPNNASPLQFTVASPGGMVVRNGIDSSHGMQLQEFLADFVIWQSGRAISRREEHRHDPWSHLIWDIVEQLQNVKFKRKRISNNSKDRLDREQGAFFDFLLSEGQMNELIQNVETAKTLNDEQSGVLGMLFIDKELK